MPAFARGGIDVENAALTTKEACSNISMVHPYTAGRCLLEPLVETYSIISWPGALLGPRLEQSFPARLLTPCVPLCANYLASYMGPSIAQLVRADGS